MPTQSGRATVEISADFANFADELQRGLNAAIRGVRVDMSSVSEQISSGVRQGVDAASNEIRRLGSQAGDTMSTVASRSDAAGRSMAESFAVAGRAMASAGDQMTMALTLPIVGAGAATIKTAGDFEKAMNAVRAATESAGAEFTGLRNLAIDLGSTTAFSATDAANAMQMMATAGFNTTDIMAALPGVLDLAAAGSVGLAEAAEIAGDILNGYGMKAGDIGKVNDILARNFLSTATSLTDLGESFKYVAPVAASAGITFTEINAAIGLLGNAGIKGSQAGTSLRGSIVALLKPTNAAANTLADLGVKVVDSHGKLLPLVKIVDQLAKSGADTADMMTIFGLESGPAMQALVSQGSAALAGLDTQLKNAGGTAQKVAATQMEGLNGSMDNLSSSVEGLMIAIGDAGLLGWATKLTVVMTEWVARTAELNPVLLRAATITAIVVAAAGPLLAIFGRMSVMIGEGIMVLQRFGGWLIRVAPWLTALAGPIGLVVAGVVALAIAAVVAYNRCTAFRNIVDSAFRAVGAAALWMWQTAIMPALTWLIGAAQSVAAAVVRLWAQAQPVFTAMGTGIMNVWTGAVRPALDAIGREYQKLGAALMGLWTTTIQPAIRSVVAGFQSLGSSVGSWWSQHGDAVFKTAATVITWWWASIVQPAMIGFMAIMRAVVTVIIWAWINVVIPAIKLAVAVMGEIVRTVQTIWAVSLPVWRMVAAAVGGAVGSMIGVIRQWGEAAEPTVRRIGAAIADWWNANARPAFTAFMDLLNRVGTVVMWLWTNGVQPAFDGIRAAITVVAATVGWFLSTVVGPTFVAIGAILVWLWTNVAVPAFNGIKAAITVVVGVVMWFWNTFGPIFTAIGSLLWSLWTGIFSVVFALLKLQFYAVIGVVQIFWAILSAAFMAVAGVVVGVWTSVIQPQLAAFGALMMWLWGVIQPVLSAVGALFVWLWSNAISPFLSWVVGGLSSLWAIVSAIFGAIVGYLQSSINQIVGIASGVAAFVNAISTHFSNAASSVREKIDAMTNFVKGIPGAIVNAIGNVGNLLYEAGQNVINGLINGITSRIGSLRDKIGEAAGAIRDALPFSPAKEGPLSGRGDPTIAGAKIVSMVADGMDSRILRLRAAAWGLADAVGPNSALLPIIQAASGQTTIAPTSTPTPVPVGVGASRTGESQPQRVYQLTVMAIDPKSAARATIEAIEEWERGNGDGWRK